MSDAHTINPWATPQQQVERPDWLTAELIKELDMYHLPHTTDGVLALHQKAKDNLDFFKIKEMELRKLSANLLIPGSPLQNEGMNTIELGNGYQAKVGIKLNYKLDSDNKKIWNALDRVAAIGNQGKFIAERLVSWTPNFLVTEYRTLQEEAESGSVEATAILKEIQEVLTITDAAPTLEIREPKAKKK